MRIPNVAVTIWALAGACCQVVVASVAHDGMVAERFVDATLRDTHESLIWIAGQAGAVERGWFSSFLMVGDLSEEGSLLRAERLFGIPLCLRRSGGAVNSGQCTTTSSSFLDDLLQPALAKMGQELRLDDGTTLVRERVNVFEEIGRKAGVCDF